jgi:peptidoglycan/xylan/chitin deacetylase (PgdA/CDA1 family)
MRMSETISFAQRKQEISQLLATQPLVRAINFHNTSRWRVEEFRQQLQHCQQNFSTVTEDDLDHYLQSGQWHKAKPGVILAFYEGYRSNYDVILPLLDELGLVGWFFVITGFIDAPVEQQLTYANLHDIGMDLNEYLDGRYAMSWVELREVDKRHVVASHALSHQFVDPMDEATRRDEIIGSQNSFRKELGHPVRTFVLRGGPGFGEDPSVDKLVLEAGYQFQFSNFQIQKLPQPAP